MINWDKYKVRQGLNVDKTWPAKDEDLSEGDFIEGRYLEMLEHVGTNDSNVYVLEVDGKKVGVWGSTVLDTKFRGIAVGKMVAVEYLGKKKSEKGGRSYHDFQVGEGIDFVGDEER